MTINPARHTAYHVDLHTLPLDPRMLPRQEFFQVIRVRWNAFGDRCRWQRGPTVPIQQRAVYAAGHNELDKFALLVVYFALIGKQVL